MCICEYFEFEKSSIYDFCHKQGLKKPYNPIIGETFRCYWKHPKTDSRTFYIAEQVGTQTWWTE